MSEAIPIACDLSVLSAAEQQQTVVTLPQLLQSVDSVEELPDGFEFRFSSQPDTWLTLAYFVGRERRCCPFLHFLLEAEPNHGPLRLQITGANGVKQFLEASYRDLAAPSAILDTNK